MTDNDQPQQTVEERVTLQNRMILAWYNRIVDAMIQEQIPPDMHVSFAHGLIFVAQLKRAGFELSEAKKAFAHVWALNAATSAPPPDHIFHPKEDDPTICGFPYPDGSACNRRDNEHEEPSHADS